MAKTATTVLADEQPVTYERPPVNEVYLSVQTKEKVFPAQDFGALVGIFGAQFPKLNTQPRMARDFEVPPEAVVSTLNLQLDLTQIGQRFWLISQDDTRVLQIQDDRVLLNWRRRDGEYPRYRVIRGEFEDALKKLTASLTINAEDLVDFCEVSYTNYIELPDGEDPRTLAHRIFRNTQQVDLGIDRVALEESSFTLAYEIRDVDNQFVGRMRINNTPMILRTTKRFIFQTQLGFRGKPATPALESALEFCDRGHIAIVSAFDRITTKEMHDYWGRK